MAQGKQAKILSEPNALVIIVSSKNRTGDDRRS